MNHKIGICLPGGGAAGASQAGMLKAVQPYRSHICAVSGASVGGLNAAMFAQNDVVNLEALWKTLRRRDVYSWFPQAFKLRSGSWFSTKPLERLIDRVVNVTALTQSHMATYIHAVEYGTGNCYRASAHDDAINFKQWLLAGSSIPAVFPPVQIADRWYQDGGVADNTPIGALIDHGCDTILVLHCHAKKGTAYTKDTPPSRLSQALGVFGQVMRASQNWEGRVVEAINELVAAGLDIRRKIQVIDIYPPKVVGTLDFDANKCADAFNQAHKQTMYELANRCDVFRVAA